VQTSNLLRSRDDILMAWRCRCDDEMLHQLGPIRPIDKGFGSSSPVLSRPVLSTPAVWVYCSIGAPVPKGIVLCVISGDVPSKLHYWYCRPAYAKLSSFSSSKYCVGDNAISTDFLLAFSVLSRVNQ